jgi:hypothetical protein
MKTAGLARIVGRGDMLTVQRDLQKVSNIEQTNTIPECKLTRGSQGENQRFLGEIAGHPRRNLLGAFYVETRYLSVRCMFQIIRMPYNTFMIFNA